MKKLLELCLKWRLLVFAFVVIVAAVGVRSAQQLPIDAVPDITNVQVQVLTNVPALGPVDVERTITFPVEASMSGLPGVEEIRSVSRFGLSAVTIVFEEGTDLLRARQLISERLVQARERLPAGASPELGPLSSGLGEIFQFEVRADNMCPAGQPDTEQCYSPMELRSVLDWFVAYELRSVPGVVEVNSFGGELKTYEVEVLPDRLRALNVSLNDLFEAIERNNATAGGGYLVRSGEQLLVRGEGRIQSLDEIGDVLIETREDGVPVRVRDVARVHLAPLIRQGAVTRDGRGEVVTGIVMMLVGANGREVVESVKAKITQISPSLPPGVRIDVFYDRSDLVNRTIHTVGKNLAEGALFVIAVLFLLLGSIRGGLIVAAAIPFAMLVAFTAMKALGLSGNLMSLGAIDFGIVVDGSIIVVENAVVHLAAAARGQKRPMTYNEAADVVLNSTLDVRKAALFGEAIIVIVYIPILTLAGIEGKMFKPMAITVLFALLGAFVASLTFVPVLVATFLRQHTEEKEPFIVRLLHRVYPRLLAPLMKAPKKVIAVSLVLLVASGVVASRMGAEFVPRLDEGAIAIQILRLPSVSLEESVQGSTRFERVIREFPEVVTVVSKTGRAEIATDPMGVELSDCIVILKPQDEWTTAHTREELIQRMSARFAEALPGLGFSFSQPIELRMAELISGTRSDVAITIYGDDLATLERLSLQVQGVVRAIPGASDVRGEQLAGLPTLEVTVDRAAASRYGISVRDALDAIEALGGRNVGEVYEGERRFRLQVRVPSGLRDDIDQVRNLPVSGQSGPLVPLGQIASIQVVDSPASVSREAVRRRTNVEANVRGRDLASFVSEAQTRVRDQVQMPPGYVVQWGGQFENLSAASERLAVAVPVALGLIFILLYMAFGQLKPALLIYLNVPFAAVGGVFLLAVRGMPFSISAAIGFIALFGIAVLNGVVLLTTVKKLREQGMSPLEAAREGAESRLRAVVMTATVAALGFIPMALSSSAGAEVQRPLATVVIGGLVSATFLTLFVLPTVYAFVYRKEEPAPLCANVTETAPRVEFTVEGELGSGHHVGDVEEERRCRPEGGDCRVRAGRRTDEHADAARDPVGPQAADIHGGVQAAHPARGRRRAWHGHGGGHRRAAAARGAVLLPPHRVAAAACRRRAGRADAREARPQGDAHRAGRRGRAPAAPGRGARARAPQGRDHHRRPKKTLAAAGGGPATCPHRGRRGYPRRHEEAAVMAGVEVLLPVVGLVATCAALGVARASYYRMRVVSPPRAPRPRPPRALAEAERAEVLSVLDSAPFADQSPAQVYAALLDAGRYLCSVRSMYRVLAAADQVRERRDQRRHPTYVKPQLEARGPNQVWSWDITKVAGPERGTYYCLYVVLDIFSRYVVAWAVAPSEAASIGQQLIDDACVRQGVQPGQLTVHADRGAPMTAKSTAQLFVDLGIAQSHSRPRVSDDNPFSEAAFKTFLYRPGMPARFGSLADARAYFAALIDWYNEVHYHSGIALLTAGDVHRGTAPRIIAQRQAVLDRAHQAHPERFVQGRPAHPAPPPVVWINPPATAVTPASPTPSTEGGPRREAPAAPGARTASRGRLTFPEAAALARAKPHAPGEAGVTSQ